MAAAQKQAGEGDRVGHRRLEDPGAQKTHHRVDGDVHQADLRRPQAQVGDLERSGGAEGQEGVDVHGAVDEREDEEQGRGPVVDEKDIPDRGAPHEDEVEQVIHVEAPLGDTRVAEPAQRPVEAVGEPRPGDDGRRCPEPVLSRGLAIMSIVTGGSPAWRRGSKPSPMTFGSGT